MKNNLFRRLPLCLLAVFLLLSVSVWAAGTIDLNHAHSLTVTAVYDEKPLTGMKFDAYLISTVDETGELTVTEPYQDFAEALDIRGENEDAWRELAQTLSQTILQDKTLRPSYSATADETGTAVFDPSMPMGLYLITGTGLEQDGYVYTTLPFFVLLPEQDPYSNTWNYDIIAKAKLQENPLLGDYRVLKVWKDEGYETRRPKSITIQLLCDGEPYGEPITLPVNGQWSYTWSDLDTNHVWTVQEAPVSGYKTPDIRQEGNTFIVTNTVQTPPGSTPGSSLPQTGQLWWPVPVLAALGLLLLVIGVSRRKRHEG